MAKFGFSPLDHAAQSARDEIQRRSEELTQAAQRQRHENVYYSEKPLWYIPLYVAGMLVMMLVYTNFQMLRHLIPMGLQLLKGILPAGWVAQKGSWIIDNMPRFHEGLSGQVSEVMIRLLLVWVIGYMLQRIIMLLAGRGNNRFIATLERTAAEMNCRKESIGDMKTRLQQETAEGFKPLAVMSNISREAENLLKKAERVIARNLRIKKAEVLVLTALSAGAMIMALIEIHQLVFRLNLQGRNEALMVSIVTILTFLFYMCFAGKRLLHYFPRLGKWLLRLILLGYAVWLSVELIVIRKQEIDLIAYFCLDMLPIPEHISQIVTNYAGPVILSLLEIGSAMGVIKATNAETELRADKEGIVVPMTDGTRQITKPAKARRLGVMAVIRPALTVILSAKFMAFLFNVAISDGASMALGAMALLAVFCVLIMSVQGMSTERFEMKYRNKGSKLQMATMLLFLLMIFALCPGDSVMIFKENVMSDLQQAQQEAQEQQEMKTLTDEINEKLNATRTAKHFSVDYGLIFTETGDPITTGNMAGPNRVETTIDAEAKLCQQTVQYEYETYTEIQDYSWPAEGMEAHNAYTTWGYSEQVRYTSYIRADGSWGDQQVPAGQWTQYTTYNMADQYVNGWSDWCSFAMAAQNVTAMEELGQETVNGTNATHYRVLTKYQDRYGFDQWDNYGNLVASYSNAEEYYNAVITEQIRQRYPELCDAFLAEVDRRYNQDYEIHMWFDDSGRLVKIEQDWTFDYYRGTFVWGDPYAFGQLIQSGFKPVTNVQYYRYDDQATPIQTPPEDAKVLN